MKFLNSERDFIAAKSVVDKKHLCVVAKNKQSGVIVGTADLEPNSSGKNIVLNVYVRPDQRGNGIGRTLMMEGIEQILIPQLTIDNLDNDNNVGDDDDSGAAVLSLDVYTQNKPALALYLKIGYEPSSPVHAGTLALANTFNANLMVSLSKRILVV
eukprot:CAMPEP_0197833172 /NCGR_PEP_ID=MMETSP1437-20131217/18084_1 /TAXON_ID=49252 ORGANISM="Eucampia antarctica, Strain CCMP1452" /NCGR_SAMPLE_ID=MMETSP1437 /ASSEMBLY_ACC=CAM_ASM_001096 /LENGTH=155 /DNA_ID=CAMNT_0043437055 /DNA_START=310 /DNA_END=777 /DNA_ORIENTATION=+